MNIKMDSDAPSIENAVKAYIEKGYSLAPAFSPEMIASPNALEAIRSSNHWFARLCQRSIVKLSKQPIRPFYLCNPVQTIDSATQVFSRYPKANIIGFLGSKQNLLALDLDHESNEMPLPSYNTLRSHTGHGWHYLFCYPPGYNKAITRNITSAGAYLLGDMCWVILPPSQHGNGKYYNWHNADEGVAQLPQELQSLPHAFFYHTAILSCIYTLRAYYYSWVLFTLLQLMVPIAARLSESNAKQKHS